ncbi:MAG: hypothetical protein NVSMB16_02840 [Acidimicrobiales bacterium]
MRLPDLLVPSDEPEPREAPPVVARRRAVVAATLVIGGALLGGTLAAPRGSGLFFALAALVALTWLVGSMLSGPLHLGRRGGQAGNPREIIAPVLAGVAAFGVFLAADLVARHVPVLSGALHRVLATADAGPVVLVLITAVGNGLAEEVFFRGALHTAFGHHRPALYATLAYAAVTVATLNVVLVLAAIAMGALWSLERRSTRGILAPILTHTVWSTLMLLALPR